MKSPCPERIPDFLWSAYYQTLFVFNYKNNLGVIRVAQKFCAVTTAALLDANCTSALFITAYNPQHGDDLAPERNIQRQETLRKTLNARGLIYYAGAGIGRDAQWDAEASFLVLGVSEAQAVELGLRFGQNAVVWGELTGEVRLIASRADW